MTPRLPLALLAVCLVALVSHAQTPEALAEARRIGLPERLGDWKLVRYISGKHAHFLFARQKQAFSLFISALKPGVELKSQAGWRSVSFGAGKIGFLHQDIRLPERSALAWRHGSQRWMIVGRIKPEEMTSLAAKL